MVVVPSGLLIVPFILIVLNLALKQAVAQLPLLVNVQRARDVGLVKINLKHLMDAIITEMLLLMASEHPKNKICVFFVCSHQVPNVNQLDGHWYPFGYQASVY